ncbi:MAG: DUF2249 domain-containing protein [Acidimicrobiia bacterium]|nr:DUF2249 domain-containing protein [Acidimicrobiia bacterium]
MDTLDVRPIEARDRHTRIFEHLEQLTTGDTLRLLVDHDPIPLRYQLDATRPDQFSWEPVESGPDVWSIDITSRARVVDARPVIAAGDEPFEMIMAAAAELADDQVLVVYAPFNPEPLEKVLDERGFDHRADEIDDGDWRVSFTRRR